MADQPYLSLQRFPGNGTTGPWEVNFAGNREDEDAGVEPYISPADVRGYIVTPATSTAAEVLDPVDLIHEGPNTFSTAIPVPTGRILLIQRQTEDGFSLVNYQRLQAVTAFDLDQANRQLLFLTQESVDRSQLAQEAAAEVRDLAQEAVATAEAALATADGAVDTADSAVVTANTALAASGVAVDDALAAVAAAATAVATANGAVVTANAIDGKAQDALDASAEAVDTANEAMALVTEAGVASFNGRQGAVVPEAGDYDSSMIPHGAGTVQTALSSGTSAIAGLQTALAGLTTDVAGKEPTIPAGNVGDYIRGDKTLGVFGTAVRTTPLTGLSLADSEAVAAEDTFLAAIGKLQAQVGNASPMFSVMWWPLRGAVPAGYVAADGQLLSRSTYPTVAAALANVPVVTDADWLADPHLRGAYSTGDTTTTFRMPDLNGKYAGSLGAVFLRGDGALSAGTAGVIQESANKSHTHTYNGGALLGVATGGTTLYANTGGTTFASGEPESRPLNVTGCWVVRLFGAVTEAGSADASQLASDFANMSATLQAGLLQAPELLWSGSAGGNGLELSLARALQPGDLVWLQHNDAGLTQAHPQIITHELLSGGRLLPFSFGSTGSTTVVVTSASVLTTSSLTAGYSIQKVFASRAKN